MISINSIMIIIIFVEIIVFSVSYSCCFLYSGNTLLGWLRRSVSEWAMDGLSTCLFDDFLEWLFDWFIQWLGMGGKGEWGGGGVYCFVCILFPVMFFTHYAFFVVVVVHPWMYNKRISFIFSKKLQVKWTLTEKSSVTAVSWLRPLLLRFFSLSSLVSFFI